jgi:hypothetical protein
LDLESEVSFLNKAKVDYGTCGSSRLDVFNQLTGELFDYKFVKEAGTGLRSAQRARNQNNVPNLKVQYEVNP